MKSPPHLLQIWLASMRHSLNLIENYENVDIDNLRLEFTCAIRQLRLGWPLIAYLKTQSISPPSPILVDDSIHPTLTEQEQEDRFSEFCTHAQQQIFTACSHQKIPIQNKHVGKWRSPTYEELLNLFIEVGQLNHRKHLLTNPAMWSDLAIAPKLFAKSVCILTDSPHEMTFAENLSFLSARLEEALGLLNDMQKIKWQGKILPPARPSCMK